MAIIAGEITTSAWVDFEEIVRDTVSISATPIRKWASTVIPARF